MIHSLLQDRATKWANEPGCPMRPQLDYMRKVGRLREVQIDAIQTYLYLKVACENRPLYDLFTTGAFNSLALDNLRLTQKARDYLATHPASLALLQLALQKDDTGKNPFAQAVKDQLEENPEAIDAHAFFRQFFYGVSYPDYLFSLPMGAGKTFLMAAILYVDLAFALQEPDNPVFARNFLILAPSGLKSSIIDSLKTIRDFDPAWVVAEPFASQLRRQIKFLVLDADSSTKQSNRVRNPNAQKIATLQPFEDLTGLVAVVNAEKVILDHLDANPTPELGKGLARTEDEKVAAANETRALLGKIPALSIFIDEAHHAASSDIKLRSVVSNWATNGNIRTVLGFSGTPFLNTPAKIPVATGTELRPTEIANTVHYFPLVEGIGDFLKKPTVHIVKDAPDSLAIVRRGLTEFLEKFKNKRYASGAAAKVAVYCGTIARLEEQIYPLAVKICEENGLSPDTAILRYHGGNKEHPFSPEAKQAFDTLDTPHSPFRIVLLVQIGKEGWDCRSLAGVVLSQEGDCPNNMVLQTSCRCLREVDKGVPDEALIVLNHTNGQLLSAQLEKQHHATLGDFQNGLRRTARLERFDRTRQLNLPTLDFLQLSIEYNTEVFQEDDTPETRLHALLHDLPNLQHIETVRESTFEELLAKGVKETKAGYFVPDGTTPTCPFHTWLFLLQKESFNFWKARDLTPAQTELLRKIHAQISLQADDGATYLSPEYDQPRIRSRAITAFWPRRRLVTHEETIPETARLLRVERLVTSQNIPFNASEDYVPTQDECKFIVEADKQGLLVPGEPFDETLKRCQTAGEKAFEAMKGLPDIPAVKMMRARVVADYTNCAVGNRTYHYLPYHTDSAFERNFLETVLQRKEFLDRDLEIFYNGDASLTEFRLRCYRRLPESQGGFWTSLGAYTPDFLILHRDRSNNRIDACLIVETKGSLYENDPAFQARKSFVQNTFLAKNAAAPGLPRFQYLCLGQDTPWENQLVKTITDFFKKD